MICTVSGLTQLENVEAVLSLFAVRGVVVTGGQRVGELNSLELLSVHLRALQH